MKEVLGISTVIRSSQELEDALKEYCEKYEKIVSGKAAGQMVASIDLEEKENMLIALVGGQSAGKSTVANGLLGYPILPTAVTATSNCPVEILYGSEPKLEVFIVEASGEEERIAKFEQLSGESMKVLLEFALACNRKGVIQFDHLSYFCREGDGFSDQLKDYEIDPKDGRQALMLLMILLGTYVSQDKLECEDQELLSIVSLRKKLINEFMNLPGEEPKDYADMDFCLRLYWPCEYLPEGTALVDLPGSGSLSRGFEKEKHQLLSHTEIIQQYLDRTDALILFFEPETRDLGLSDIVEKTLSGNVWRDRIGREDCFSIIINKADIYADEKSKLRASEKTIRTNFEKYFHIPVIYPVSGYYGEYRYVCNGIPLERTRYYRKNYPKKVKEREKVIASLPAEFQSLAKEQMTESVAQDIQKEMAENFSKVTFPCLDGVGEAEGLTLESFYKNFIRDYAARVRLIKNLEKIQKLGADSRQTLGEIFLKTEVLNSLLRLAEDLPKMLMEAVGQCVEDVVEELSGEVVGIDEKIQDALGESSEILAETEDSIKEKMKGIRKTIKNHMIVTLEKAKKTFFSNKIKINVENEKVIAALKKYLEEYDAMEIFTMDRGILEEQLDDQQRIYDKGIEALKSLYENLGVRCEAALREGFGRALKQVEDQEDKRAFEDCFYDIQKSTVEFVESVAETAIVSLEEMKHFHNTILLTKKELDDFFDYKVNDICRSGGQNIYKSFTERHWFTDDKFDYNAFQKVPDESIIREGDIEELCDRLEFILTIDSPETETGTLFRSLRWFLVKLKWIEEPCRAHKTRSREALKEMMKISDKINQGMIGKMEEISQMLEDSSKELKPSVEREIRLFREMYLEIVTILEDLSSSLRESTERLQKNRELEGSIQRAGEIVENLIGEAREKIREDGLQMEV